MATKLIFLIVLFTTTLFSYEVSIYERNDYVLLDFNTDWNNVGGDEGTNWVAIYKKGDSNDWDNVITWAWAKDLAHDENENYDYRVFSKVTDVGEYEVRFFLDNSYDVFASCSYNVDNCTRTISNATDLKKAASGLNVNSGDIICVAQGTYEFENIDFSVSGDSNGRITFIGKGNVKLIGEKELNKDSSNLYISGSWLTFKNFEVSNFQNGVHITRANQMSAPSHNIIEDINSHNNWFSAISIEGSFEDNATGYIVQDHSGSNMPSYNLIKNCKASFSRAGEDGDGINIRAGVGVGNVIENCEAFDNDDDGFDLWQAGEKVVIRNSIAIANGQSVAGSGFKLGEAVRDRDSNGDIINDTWADDQHELINCTANNNSGYGFTDSEAKVGRTLIDCNATNNYENFYFVKVFNSSTFSNCISNGNPYPQ